MSVNCSRCGDEIKCQSDLIVTSSLFHFDAYHTECYGLTTKSSDALFTGKPINSHQGTLVPILLFILYLFNLLIPSFRSEPILHLIYGSLVVFSASTRLYSYFKFEKQL